MSSYRTQRAQRTHAQAGFSLLELMVVVVIIAAAYTLLPKFVSNGVSGADLKSNTREIATSLRAVRASAINTRRETMLTIDLDKREFTMSGDTRVRKLNDQLDLKLFTAQSDVVTDKIGFIRFFPDGTSNGGRITVGAGERKFYVDVDWLTGKVSILDKVDDERA
jgi:general secretion pathway protein H